MLEDGKQAFWLGWRAYEMVSSPRSYDCRLVHLNRIFNAIRCIRDTPCVTDHRCEICPDQVRQRVDSVLHSFSASQKRNRNLLDCEEQTVSAVPLWFQGPFQDPHQPLKTAGERCGFVKEKSTDDACIRLASIHRFLVLLLSNIFGFGRDFCRSLGCAISQHRYTNCCTGRNGADDHSHPIGQIPYLVRQRTELNRHRPSLLEPILP